MPYIYLDESGDLGFDFSKQKTSKHFVVIFLFVKDSEKKPIEKIIKKIFKSFTKKEIKSHPNSLHAYKEKPKTRIRLFNFLNQQDISIITIYLKKDKVYTQLQDEKQVLYNYITNILLDRVLTKKLIPLKSKIQLIASQRETNKFFNQNFKQYLETQVRNNHKIDFAVKIKPSSQEKCLQIVDFACWAIFRKYEKNDESYYNIFKQKIVEENSLFK
ncbi:MAG: DUF3800 domain-containing protein [Candidatus Gracilibacteria bacterium]|jgi:hypothetical protein